MFRATQQLAQARGWPFNWRLVTAEGIAHEGRRMMRSPEMLETMGLSTKNEGMTIQLHGHCRFEGGKAGFNFRDI